MTGVKKSAIQQVYRYFYWPKDPKCVVCCLNKTCKYFKSSKKIRTTSKKMYKNKNYDIFCFLNKIKFRSNLINISLLLFFLIFKNSSLKRINFGPKNFVLLIGINLLYLLSAFL